MDQKFIGSSATWFLRLAGASVTHIELRPRKNDE